MVSKDIAKEDPNYNLTELSVETRFSHENTFKAEWNSDSDLLTCDLLKRIGKKLNKIDLTENRIDRFSMQKIEKSLAMNQEFLENINIPQVNLSAKISPYDQFFSYSALQDKTVKYILWIGFFKKKDYLVNEYIEKDGRKCLDVMKQLVKESRNLLLLGEPDYIDLYLKHFPIVTSPYLTQSTAEEEKFLE